MIKTLDTVDGKRIALEAFAGGYQILGSRVVLCRADDDRECDLCLSTLYFLDPKCFPVGVK